MIFTRCWGHKQQLLQPNDRTTITKTVEVIPFDKQAKTYTVTTEEAKGIVAGNGGIWKGRNRVIMKPDRNIGVTWNVRQSGRYGPLVLQVQT